MNSRFKQFFIKINKKLKFSSKEYHGCIGKHKYIVSISSISSFLLGYQAVLHSSYPRFMEYSGTLSYGVPVTLLKLLPIFVIIALFINKRKLSQNHQTVGIKVKALNYIVGGFKFLTYQALIFQIGYFVFYMALKDVDSIQMQLADNLIITLIAVISYYFIDYLTPLIAVILYSKLENSL